MGELPCVLLLIDLFLLRFGWLEVFRGVTVRLELPQQGRWLVNSERGFAFEWCDGQRFDIVDHYRLVLLVNGGVEVRVGDDVRRSAAFQIDAVLTDQSKSL